VGEGAGEGGARVALIAITRKEGDWIEGGDRGGKEGGEGRGGRGA